MVVEVLAQASSGCYVEYLGAMTDAEDRQVTFERSGAGGQAPFRHARGQMCSVSAPFNSGRNTGVNVAAARCYQPRQMIQHCLGHATGRVQRIGGRHPA